MEHERQNTVYGFTLIELLIALAIISILASVVLIEFPVAINRFRDGRAMSSMGQIRKEAAIIYFNTENYTGLNCAYCTGCSGGDCTCVETDIDKLCIDVSDNSDQDIKLRINKDGSGFCAVAHLQGEGKYFCIDSALRAEKYDISPAVNGNACKQACENQNNCACE